MKPGQEQRSREFAALYGLGCDSALSGDSWYPDSPRAIENEIELRLNKFSRDCKNLSLNDWYEEAVYLGYLFENCST